MAGALPKISKVPSSEVNISLTDVENVGEKLSNIYYQRYLMTKKHTKFLTKSELDNHPPSQETEYMYLATAFTESDFDDSSEEDESEEEESDVEEEESDVEEEESDGEEQLDYGLGFWMMHVPLDLLDVKWKKLCHLFFSFELLDIDRILVSTDRRNPRANNLETGVLLAYCAPWQDEELMRRVGHNLAIKMSFYSDTKFMFFKPTWMIGRGTRATGRKINSYYRIPVPETAVEAYSQKYEVKDLLNDEKKYTDWLNRQKIYKRNIINMEKGIAPWVLCELNWRLGQDVRLLD